jgi:hypothetical protein
VKRKSFNFILCFLVKIICVCVCSAYGGITKDTAADSDELITEINFVPLFNKDYTHMYRIYVVYIYLMKFQKSL